MKWRQKSIQYLSLSFSRRYDPIPEPVPPAIEWVMTKPWENNYSLNNIKIISYNNYYCYII